MTRHRTDVLSLLFGLAFMAVATFALAGLVALPGPAIRWGGAGLLVTIGVVLLVTARTKNEDDDPTRDIS